MTKQKPLTLKEMLELAKRVKYWEKRSYAFDETLNSNRYGYLYELSINSIKITDLNNSGVEFGVYLATPHTSPEGKAIREAYNKALKEYYSQHNLVSSRERIKHMKRIDYTKRARQKSLQKVRQLLRGK